MPVGAFVAERVLLPTEPPGQMFNAWFTSQIRAAGYELRSTMKTPSAPWDRRMLPIAAGEAVCPFVAEWIAGPRAWSGCRSIPGCSSPRTWRPVGRQRKRWRSCSRPRAGSATTRAG